MNILKRQEKNQLCLLKEKELQIPQAQSLSKQFFTELIKLENAFQNKIYTLDTLNELTQYYAVRFS